MFFLLKVHPAIRVAIGVVVFVIGIVLHKVIIDAAGAAVTLVGAAQWASRGRRSLPR